MFYSTRELHIQIGVAGKDPKSITKTLNSDLTNISDWMAANKLSLNKSKTEYMIIGSHQNLKKWNSDFRIVIGCESLGVMIDETLTWHAFSSGSYNQKSKQKALCPQTIEGTDLKTLVTAYKTLVQPHFDSCSQVWGSLGITLQNKLQRLQN